MPEKRKNGLLHLIGYLLPPKLKRALIWIINRPARIQAASQGKLPCPDKLFLKWMFKNFTGKKLNLANPVTYQEKLNWLKLYYRNPLYTKLVDKYSVREWVAEKVGKEILVPLYGVYNNFEEIDFDKLPNKFVLKCTHDSGSVVICKDKAKFDQVSARQKLTEGLARKQFYLSREWPYKNVVPRIICEKFLEDEQVDDAPDYKFFCFDGKVKVIMVNSERHSDTGVKVNLYDMNWTRLPVQEIGYPNNPKPDIKPRKLDEMIKLAEILSTAMPHVRVDFNYVNEQIYFGEMTFFHAGGRKFFHPYDFNVQMGKWLRLPDKI